MAERVRVDETDFRILREIFQGEESFRSDRVSIEAIAKRLGVHRNTVSQRVKRLTEGNALLPASLEVEPAHFGLVGALAFLDVPAERRDGAARDSLFALPGVQAIFEFVEGWTLIAYSESEEGLFALIENARRATGAPSVKLDILTSRDYPPVTPLRFSALDARLMRALLRDARAPFPAIAKELGTTTMTVMRRYDRLRREGVFYVYPSGNAAIEGMVMGFVRVDVPDGADAAKEAVGTLLANAWIRNAAARASVLAIVYARSLAELEAQAKRLRALPGVAAVEMRLFTEISFNKSYRGWIAGVIERRAAPATP